MSVLVQVSESPGFFEPNEAEGMAASQYLSWKRQPVQILGVVLAIGLLPLILLLIGLVRLTSPGPGLYSQRRVGYRGREFTIYKLRSMYQDAESASGAVWSTKGDPRVTPIGRFLRYSHLDELPQIFNVVRGEMDFIGPRPERPVFVSQLSRQVEGYTDRLTALPGITGLAQVNLEPDETIDCVVKKAAADRYYISNASLWLDLRLVFATVLRIFGVRYHHGAKLLGVTLPIEVTKTFPPKPESSPYLDLPAASAKGDHEEAFGPAGVSDVHVPVGPVLNVSRPAARLSVGPNVEVQSNTTARRLPR